MSRERGRTPSTDMRGDVAQHGPFADPGAGADPDIDITHRPTGGPEVLIRLFAAVAHLEMGSPIPGVEPPLHRRARDGDSDRRQPCQMIRRNSAWDLAIAQLFLLQMLDLLAALSAG